MSRLYARHWDGLSLLFSSTSPVLSSDAKALIDKFCQALNQAMLENWDVPPSTDGPNTRARLAAGVSLYSGTTAPLRPTLATGSSSESSIASVHGGAQAEQTAFAPPPSSHGSDQQAWMNDTTYATSCQISPTSSSVLHSSSGSHTSLLVCPAPDTHSSRSDQCQSLTQTSPPANCSRESNTVWTRLTSRRTVMDIVRPARDPFATV